MSNTELQASNDNGSEEYDGERLNTQAEVTAHIFMAMYSSCPAASFERACAKALECHATQEMCDVAEEAITNPETFKQLWAVYGPSHLR